MLRQVRADILVLGSMLLGAGNRLIMELANFSLDYYAATFPGNSLLTDMGRCYARCSEPGNPAIARLITTDLLRCYFMNASLGHIQKLSSSAHGLAGGVFNVGSIGHKPRGQPYCYPANGSDNEIDW